MNTVQLQTLLKDSSNHYRHRNLKKALNSAQIALDFGLEEGANSYEIIRANVLLSGIYNTNGKYQCDTTFFSKALQAAEAALALNHSEHSPKLEVDILLQFGQIWVNLEQAKEAEDYFNQAFQASQKVSDSGGIVRALAGLSQSLVLKNDLDKALQYAQDGLTFLENSEASEDVNLLAEIYTQLSQTYLKRKEYSQSLEHSQTLLNLSQQLGDVEKEVIALKNIAIVCGVKSNYKIGMQYFLDALDKSEEIGYRQNIVAILINISTIYAHLFNYTEAIQRYKTILEEHEDILEERTKVIVYNNLGNIYFSIDQPKIAQQYFVEAHQVAVKCDYQEMIAHTLAQISRTCAKLGQMEEANAYALQAQALIEVLGDVNGKQINLLNLCRHHFEKKEYKRAIELAKEGIEVAKKMKDDTTEIRAYRLLAKVYEAVGEYKNALHYQVIYSKIQEEFTKMQRSRQFLDMEIRHAIKEKQKEIEQLTKNNEYQALLLEKSDQIARQNEELLRVNEDLRQFAYVSSHDLKEPLRMIGSYSQLLDRRLKGKLDEEGSLFFHYIIDGVKRMNSLLDALLKYATIGRSEEEVEVMDLNNIVQVCLANLKVRVEETNATIETGILPTVEALPSLPTQLFQNLISNALKFRKPDITPIITITAKTTFSEHIICVRDNGIGISPDHQHRIFEIFQRLHTRLKYQGTGIGLAICQKIVQRLGGRIWVESEEGAGAAFYFSIPKKL